MTEVMVLGPLIVVVGGEQVSLGPQTGLLLLVLLLARGRPVSSTRLAELLGKHDSVQPAPPTLRSHVAHLRRALNQHPAKISGRPIDYGLVTNRMGNESAYSFHIDPGQLDMTRFERLVIGGREHMEMGRWHEASTSFNAALTLWRRRPFSNVGDRPFAALEVRRLEALYRLARSVRIEADMMLGRHREVTAELEVMVTRWPDDEGLRELLVVCLARAARTAEAVQVCREGINVAHSQGLDPFAMDQLITSLLRAPTTPLHRFSGARLG